MFVHLYLLMLDRIWHATIIELILFINQPLTDISHIVVQHLHYYNFSRGVAQISNYSSATQYENYFLPVFCFV